ncbi:Holliday junction branch migration protein RuvA [Candidatus Formimonas warabiya]|uniref:Holliday junction branch migration complex subunit RuvA n=1 Tax=Formimonas warabiya TaxID=1761012 RepID=A0A3G1KN81_FORW1|nr:Holliday junction branch migration protein RuvA [Candidatus Formimonas warabiya]ATW23951.1 Holliday junction DNA helicase RuvA [Candidatus Formimonas warabiya]
MISFVRGNLFAREEESVTLDVGGIGYLIMIPPAVLPQDLKIGDELLLHTYLQVREDNWQLFGFPQKEQLEVFRLLITVSGIGARLGLAILNHFSYLEVMQLVASGDSNKLSCVPGIGKKIAQRLVLELKEKFKKLDPAGLPQEAQTGEGDLSLNQDVVLALTQLGYPMNEARAAFLKVSKSLGPEADSQGLIKGALKLLGKF